MADMDLGSALTGEDPNSAAAKWDDFMQRPGNRQALLQIGLNLMQPTAIGQTTIRPVFFFEGEYESGGSPAFLRLHTGIGTVSWDGKDWTGAGSLLSISPIRESRGLEAIAFSVQLSGLPASLRSIALQSFRKNRPGKVWLGFYDAAGALVVSPYAARRGRFDTATIARDGETMTIEVVYEDRLVELERARERRYTHEDQQIRLAGDRGFEQVPQLQDAADVWGAPAPLGTVPPWLARR